MKGEEKTVMTVKKSGNKKGNLKLLPDVSANSPEKISRPRPMTPQEAKWIAAGKKMKLV